MHYKNKTVVVTGAARGIGAACARLFHEAGAKVALLDLHEPETVGEEERWLFFNCDVAAESEVASAFSTIERRFGQVDILVNNAGIQRYGSVTETSTALWDEVMQVNLRGVFLCARYALDNMVKQGKGVIINVSSVQAFVSQTKVAAYTTAKTALLGLTRSIAVDYGPQIRCVAVCPGTVDTPLFRDAIALSPDPAETIRQCRDMHLVGRIATPEEIAELILYLSNDKASFITGQAIRIDGGLGVGIPGVVVK